MIITFLLISALLRRLGSVVLKLFHVLFMVRALLDSSPERCGKANTSTDNFIQKWGSAARNCNFPKGKQQSSSPSATSKEHHNRSKSAPWSGRSAAFGIFWMFWITKKWTPKSRFPAVRADLRRGQGRSRNIRQRPRRGVGER